jgi:hypothetical protein
MEMLMRKLAATALMLLWMSVCFGSRANAQVSINIRIGPPPAPHVVHQAPPRPGPSYVWVEGYWYPVDNRYVWHNGYWTRAPYEGAHWVQPHYEGQHYYYGYWEGQHGRVPHDHGWDKKKDRDYGHGRGRGQDK